MFYLQERYSRGYGVVLLTIRAFIAPRSTKEYHRWLFLHHDYAWLITSGVLPKGIQSYSSNAAEADNRIWRHATQTSATKILRYGCVQYWIQCY